MKLCQKLSFLFLADILISNYAVNLPVFHKNRADKNIYIKTQEGQDEKSGCFEHEKSNRVKCGKRSVFDNTKFGLQPSAAFLYEAYALWPPTQLGPSQFTGIHDGTKHFTYSPYYFSPYKDAPRGNGASVNAMAKTSFSMKYYGLNHDLLSQVDAQRYEDAEGGVTYLTIDRFPNGFPEFYYVMVNTQGEGSTIQGSSVEVQHNGIWQN